MSVSRRFVAAGIAAVLACTALPALAQRHGGGGGQSRGASPRAGGGQGGGASPRAGGGASNRGVSRAAPPRSARVSPGPGSHRGYYTGGRVAPRYSRVAPVHFYRPYYTFSPRVSLGFGLWAGYPFAYSYGFYDPFYYPYGYANPYVYSPYGYATPNVYPPYGYTTPNGYPPYGYPGTTRPAPPSGWSAPQDSPDPPSSILPGQQEPQSSILPGQQEQQVSIGVQQPGQANTGGVSFEITPNTAELFVDDILVGTVGQFTSTTQPLGLAAGHHQIEVRAPGYETMSFEVEIIAGQVIPFQGAMER